MSEHYTQGRQGQGSRRRKGHYNKHNRKPRVFKEERVVAKKTSWLSRILGFFGIGTKSKPVAPKSTTQKNKRGEQKGERTRQGNKQNKAKGSIRERIPTNPPTRNARLHVGNLSYEATESELEDLFKGFGAVRSVTVIYNRRTYRSKGYAFIEMRYLEDAQKAAEVLHGQPFMGRELIVSAADDKPEEREPREKTEETSLDTEEQQEETSTTQPLDPGPESFAKNDDICEPVESTFTEEVVFKATPKAAEAPEEEPKA